jgi:hypothetical protein
MPRGANSVLRAQYCINRAREDCILRLNLGEYGSVQNDLERCESPCAHVFLDVHASSFAHLVYLPVCIT